MGFFGQTEKILLGPIDFGKTIMDIVLKHLLDMLSVLTPRERSTCSTLVTTSKENRDSEYDKKCARWKAKVGHKITEYFLSLDFIEKIELYNMVKAPLIKSVLYDSLDGLEKTAIAFMV